MRDVMIGLLVGALVLVGLAGLVLWLGMTPCELVKVLPATTDIVLTVCGPQ